MQSFNAMVDRMMARSPVNGLNVYPEGAPAAHLDPSYAVCPTHTFLGICKLVSAFS